MGSTCYCSEIEGKSKKLLIDVNEKIENYEKEINNLEKSIEDKKQEILNEMDEQDDYQINNKVSEFYKLINQKAEKLEIVSSYKNCKEDLNKLIKEKSQNNNDEENNPEKRKNKLKEIKNKFNSLNMNKGKKDIN